MYELGLKFGISSVGWLSSCYIVFTSPKPRLLMPLVMSYTMQ